MKLSPSSKAVGFSLVEVTLALGVATFCLIAILGMLPVGLTSGQNAAAQTSAVNILNAVAADLRDTPPASGNVQSKSPFYGFNVPGTAGTTIYVDESGKVVGSTLARFRVQVSTVFQPAAGARSATRERVVISWPAPASNPAGSVESVVALDRN